MKYVPLFFLPLLTSCAQTVWVYEDRQEEEAEKLKGLPFYVKVEREMQTTVYEKKWTEVTFSVTKLKAVDSDNEKTEQEIYKTAFTKQIDDSKRSDFDTLKENLLKLSGTSNPDEVLVQRVIAQFQSIPSIDLQSLTPELVSNLKGTEWVVDNKKHYLNAPLPWFGSSELTYDLRDDGTLAKTTSKSDNSNLATAITSFIPFKEYFDAKWVQPKLAKFTTSTAGTEKGRQGAAHPSSEELFSYQFSLSMENKGEQFKCKVINGMEMPEFNVEKMQKECVEYTFSTLPIQQEQSSEPDETSEPEKEKEEDKS